jgi:prolyl oligopeptidase
MNRRHFPFSFRSFQLLVASFFIISCTWPIYAQVPAPPTTRQDNVVDEIHGVKIVDPYRWLEDPDSEETRRWETAQNAYLHSQLDGIPLLPSIQRRMKEMLVHDTIGGPSYRNGYYFFYSRKAGQDLWSLLRRKGISGKDEIVLDPHPLSPDHTTSIRTYALSEDANMLLYGVQRGGEDETDVRVLDIGKHHDLPDVLPRAVYTGVAWNKDLTGFFYVTGPRGAARRMLYHILGTDPADDHELFVGSSPDLWITPTVSPNGRYLLIESWRGHTSTEVYIQDLEHHGPIRPLVTGIDAQFSGQFAGDILVVRTDWQAPNYRVLKIDLRNPAQDKWREIVPSGQDAMGNITLIGSKLFVTYLHNVTSQILIFSLEGRRIGQVALPPAVSAGMWGRYGQDEGILYFTSFTTPYSYYRLSASTGKRDLWYRDPIEIDAKRYVAEQVWYSSKDGTQIPMFLVYRKGLKVDGQCPVLLYGYGGYGVSQTPGFDQAAAWWAEQGGIYALANIRGGGEFGKKWHQAGKLDKKQNVFDDFIAAAEWLISQKYTNPHKLSIWGASNGGLLVGAVTTQRPDLFRAVICEHPDLDIVRYPQFTRNNLAHATLEYGNSTDPEQFKFVYAYSPYQHVKVGTKYPAMLFTSGDADTRVPPEQARKMTARMQAATTSGLPVLLMYDVKAGHSGGRPFSQIVDELSLKLAFLAAQIGMN